MTWHFENYVDVFNDYIRTDPWYDLTSSPFMRAMLYAGSRRCSA